MVTYKNNFWKYFFTFFILLSITALSCHIKYTVQKLWSFFINVKIKNKKYIIWYKLSKIIFSVFDIDWFKKKIKVMQFPWESQIFLDTQYLYNSLNLAWCLHYSNVSWGMIAGNARLIIFGYASIPIIPHFPYIVIY